MVRRHRLMETFLVRELGYGWDEVHDEAEILEHAVSDRLLDRIDAKLGYPTRDPHGDPIPATDGRVPTPPARQLSVCQDGDAGTVARISDADPEMLRYFDSVGISLDSRLRVLARRDFAGTISVAIELPGTSGSSGSETVSTTVDLGRPAAQAIWVVA
jgi:DtxR family Mn-dependent transcriptional regulator